MLLYFGLFFFFFLKQDVGLELLIFHASASPVLGLQVHNPAQVDSFCPFELFCEPSPPNHNEFHTLTKGITGRFTIPELRQTTLHLLSFLSSQLTALYLDLGLSQNSFSSLFSFLIHPILFLHKHHNPCKGSSPTYSRKLPGPPSWTPQHPLHTLPSLLGLRFTSRLRSRLEHCSAAG